MTPQIWHPFTQHGLKQPIPEVVEASGAVLKTREGREVIDAISSWWVQTHGHCHPKIVAAIQGQTAQLDQIIFAGWTHEPAQALAQELGAFLPAELSHLFFSDSGSTAVEVALKMALGYWHNNAASQSSGQTAQPRRRILVMEHSYHGDTIGAMSVGARGVFNQAYDALLFDVGTVRFPEAGQEEETLKQLTAFCADKDNPPAALIIEPLVLGAGGMKIYSPETLRALYDICRAHDVLFIADEVMTGWGRTGSLFAFQQADIVPDIMCMAKGLTGGVVPLALTAARQPIYDAHYSTDRAKMFFHSSSFTANPIACAAARANLEIWRTEDVQGRIDHIAAQHAAFARSLQKAAAISSVRQCGTILAFELDQESASYMSDLGPRLLSFFAERDVLLRPLGNCVYIMPPYCITDAQLNRIYAVIGEAIEAFTN